MKFKDLLVMCWRNLYRRKVRTILTVIGVVIGTCSIVVMVSLGIGLKTYFDADMESYTDMTVITVTNPDEKVKVKKVTLTDKKIDEFKKMEHVTVVSPTLNVGEMVQISSGQYTYDGSMGVTAMDLSTMKDFGYKVEEGELSESVAEDSIYFGAQTPWSFVDSSLSIQPEYGIDEEGNYTDPPPLNVMSSQMAIAPVKNNTDSSSSSSSSGSSSSSSGTSTESTGTTSTTGSDTATPKKSTGTAINLNSAGLLKGDWAREGSMNGAIISLDVGLRLKSEYNMLNGISNVDTKYDSVKVKVDNYESVAGVEEAIKAQGYTTTSAREFREAMGKTAKMIQLILGGLGAISLFVAALGISNTMIMSIYERTREIGVMKVLGCPLKDIRTMFLTEAGAIGFLGGVLGIILSYIISFIINIVVGAMSTTANTISVIPFWLVLVGMGFSVGVGLLSGFSPANRAVKISPLAAIRQD